MNNLELREKIYNLIDDLAQSVDWNNSTAQAEEVNKITDQILALIGKCATEQKEYCACKVEHNQDEVNCNSCFSCYKPIPAEKKECDEEDDPIKQIHNIILLMSKRIEKLECSPEPKKECEHDWQKIVDVGNQSSSYGRVCLNCGKHDYSSGSWNEPTDEHTHLTVNADGTDHYGNGNAKDCKICNPPKKECEHEWTKMKYCHKCDTKEWETPFESINQPPESKGILKGAIKAAQEWVEPKPKDRIELPYWVKEMFCAIENEFDIDINFNSADK
jgi:hypothetical protein